MKRFVIVTVISMLTSIGLRAQVEVGLGAEMGFPMLFNGFVKGHNHASGAPGIRGVINYSPANAQFTGSIVAGISPMVLPVVRFNNGLDVLYMNFTNANISLLGRFKKELNNDARLMYGLGVGVNYLSGNNVQISKRSDSDNEIQRIISDSSFYNTATVPSFYLNIEYMKPLKPGSNVYFGIGAQLHYIYFLSQTANYRVDMIDKYNNYYVLNPELTGSMINPMFYINLYYRLGKSNSY